MERVGNKKEDPSLKGPLCLKAEPGLEPELAVRGLATALAAVAVLVFQHEVDRRGGDGLFDVSAADAGAVGAVPVALDNHRTVTAGANSGK